MTPGGGGVAGGVGGFLKISVVPIRVRVIRLINRPRIARQPRRPVQQILHRVQLHIAGEIVHRRDIPLHHQFVQVQSPRVLRQQYIAVIARFHALPAVV